MGLFDEALNMVQSSARMAESAAIFAKNGFRLFGNGGINNRAAARALRKSFEELGATYIKLGQLIASAPGIFPREYVEEMQHCLDSINPLPYATIHHILEQEFPGRVNEIFAHIDAEPLASASIAQVHAARLTTGEDVVIKVQRPGIERKLNADLNLLYFSVWLFEKIAPGAARASLTGIVEDFHKTIMEETDFLREARNIEEFEGFLHHVGQQRVCVPKVYHRASTKKVLTMERFHGVPLTDLDSIKAYTKSPPETLTLALNTWFQSLVFCGFFHADVHAGNLMVLTDGRIGFIDFGIVGRMDQKIWDALLDLMDGLSKEDYSLIAKALVNMNATDAKVNVELFSRQIEVLFKNFYDASLDFEKSGELDETRINKLMIDLVQISEKNGLKIPREFALLFKQLLYFDRYIRLLAPDMNIMETEAITTRKKLKAAK